MADPVESGAVPGLVWLVAHAGEVYSGSAGVLDLETSRPVTRRSIFRISSTTKPITAACAMTLVDEGVIGLDDPVTDLLPELSERTVLAVPGGPLDDTVPASRDITLRDLLSFRLGLGGDFTGARQPAMERAASLGLPVGPPRPADYPDPDEYLRILGSVPLEYQPGAHWLYHVGADVAGVLIARACGTSFQAALRERVLDPLGMSDTRFFVPRDDLDRFGALYWTADGRRDLFDPPDGQWGAPPPFEGGGAGLVSTVDDLLAFAAMMRDGGRHEDGQGGDVRVLSPEAVVEMTTDQLTAEQRATGPGGDEAGLGWGLGMAVQVEDVPTRSIGGFGWDGGLGTTWSVDPHRDLIAILLTNEAWSSPEPPALHQDFLRGAVRLTDDVDGRSE
ncbi:MAG: serine hydrolase domain-containing protein [Ilumatobacteraceae bacterium]